MFHHFYLFAEIVLADDNDVITWVLFTDEIYLIEGQLIGLFNEEDLGPFLPPES